MNFTEKVRQLWQGAGTNGNLLTKPDIELTTLVCVWQPFRPTFPFSCENWHNPLVMRVTDALLQQRKYQKSFHLKTETGILCKFMDGLLISP